MSLHDKSVLVKLTVRSWDGFKKDKRVSERVDEEFKTDGNAGNYNKRLLGKGIMAPIQRAGSAIRQEHARLTMPWCYDGVSLLPSKLFMEYTQKMRELKDAYYVQVDNLVQQYPIHKANQAVALGELFRPDDYPANDDLRHRFSVDYQFFPVPQTDHFVVDLAQAEKDALSQALKQELQDAQSNALRSVYDRVFDILGHMHERLSDPSNIFRDSLVDNVWQMVEVLPGLNVFNDPLLDEVVKRAKAELLIADAADLRTDQDLREVVADSAFDIANFLKGEGRWRKAA